MSREENLVTAANLVQTTFRQMQKRIQAMTDASVKKNFPTARPLFSKTNLGQSKSTANSILVFIRPVDKTTRHGRKFVFSEIVTIASMINGVIQGEQFHELNAYVRVLMTDLRSTLLALIKQLAEFSEFNVLSGLTRLTQVAKAKEALGVSLNAINDQVNWTDILPGKKQLKAAGFKGEVSCASTPSQGSVTSREDVQAVMAAGIMRRSETVNDLLHCVEDVSHLLASKA